jgi:hypothetical protein
VPGESYGSVYGWTFSPDSKHVIYWAQDEGTPGHWRIIVDGKSNGELMGAISGFVFESPSEFRTLAYMYSRGSGIEIYRLIGRIGGN